jgi:hypothetical protein
MFKISCFFNCFKKSSVKYLCTSSKHNKLYLRSQAKIVSDLKNLKDKKGKLFGQCLKLDFSNLVAVDLENIRCWNNYWFLNYCFVF